MASVRDKLIYFLPFLGLWVLFGIWIASPNDDGRPSHPTVPEVVNPNRLSKAVDISSESSSSPKTADMSVQVPNLNDMKNSTPLNVTIDNGNLLKVITWNLQGIFRDSLKERTEAVLRVIQRERPDVFMCQELVESSYGQLNSSLQDIAYTSVIGTQDGKPSRYFTGIFFNTKTLTLVDHHVSPFLNSDTGRTKLTSHFKLNSSPKVRLVVLNTHLESLPLPDRSIKRLEQLEECFGTCINYSETVNVVFGGDLNLEENEEKGKVPKAMKDLWKESGSSKDTEYTWDSVANKNDKFSVPNQVPKVRYDRMYFRSSSPPSVKFKTFELLGKNSVPGTDYFPSDHWAIMSTFEVLSSKE